MVAHVEQRQDLARLVANDDQLLSARLAEKEIANTRDLANMANVEPGPHEDVLKIAFVDRGLAAKTVFKGPSRIPLGEWVGELLFGHIGRVNLLIASAFSQQSLSNAASSGSSGHEPCLPRGIAG